MTITEIRNQIITVLLKNDYFELNSDSKSIKVPKSLSVIKNQLIENAFLVLEETGIATKIKGEDNIFWLMGSDIRNKDQTVNVNIVTADAISNLINQYRVAMNIKQGESDKLKITEDDIQSLIVICGSLLNNVEKTDTTPEEEN